MLHLSLFLSIFSHFVCAFCRKSVRLSRLLSISVCCLASLISSHTHSTITIRIAVQSLIPCWCDVSIAFHPVLQSLSSFTLLLLLPKFLVSWLHLSKRIMLANGRMCSLFTFFPISQLYWITREMYFTGICSSFTQFARQYILFVYAWGSEVEQKWGKKSNKLLIDAHSWVR